MPFVEFIEGLPESGAFMSHSITPSGTRIGFWKKRINTIFLIENGKAAPVPSFDGEWAMVRGGSSFWSTAIPMNREYILYHGEDMKKITEQVLWMNDKAVVTPYAVKVFDLGRGIEQVAELTSDKMIGFKDSVTLSDTEILTCGFGDAKCVDTRNMSIRDFSETWMCNPTLAGALFANPLNNHHEKNDLVFRQTPTHWQVRCKPDVSIATMFSWSPTTNLMAVLCHEGPQSIEKLYLVNTRDMSYTMISERPFSVHRIYFPTFEKEEPVLCRLRGDGVIEKYILSQDSSLRETASLAVSQDQC